ncbi:MAG: hypothetical protein ACRELV_01430, partial [Longimicrobiales bacterium]
AQAVQASLGQIPTHALAVGVEVMGSRVRLRFQLSEATKDDIVDMDDIVSELEALVGNDVHVDKIHEVRPEREISPSGPRSLDLPGSRLTPAAASEPAGFVGAQLSFDRPTVAGRNSNRSKVLDLDRVPVLTRG